MTKNSKYNLPACLIIMDGFGISPNKEGNAIYQANTPNLDRLMKNYPNCLLEASGEAVGLPKGQMGNSEVGHLNIGAGRVVKQELMRIDEACVGGEIKNNIEINRAIEHAIKNNSVLHLMGLVSDGGVHSSVDHLFSILDSAVEQKVQKIRIHAFLDGRDVPPKSSCGYIEQLEKRIKELKEENPQIDLKIASICGRYYAMDRDNRFERIEQAYDAIVLAENYQSHMTPIEYINKSYDQGTSDEFVVPASFCIKGIKDGDSCIFFNFRPDRAREITRAITEQDFSGFSRVAVDDLYFECMTEYDETFNLPIAFKKNIPNNVLAQVISDQGFKQFHTAETEKYAHVTFFLNGGVEKPFVGEERILINSPKVATYDLKPEMSAFEVTKKLEEAILEQRSDFYIVNFANCDMVGHTGDMQAAIRAVETVDKCVSKITEAIESVGGFALITADHGNADKMIADNGEPHTAHTTAPVPLVLFYNGNKKYVVDKSVNNPALCDIAPTLLDIAGLRIPNEMSGRILFQEI